MENCLELESKSTFFSIPNTILNLSERVHVRDHYILFSTAEANALCGDRH